MLGTPNPEKPIFGMLTNSSHFLFAKLVKGEMPQYALSDEFVLRRRENELSRVLSVLKRLARFSRSHLSNLSIKSGIKSFIPHSRFDLSELPFQTSSDNQFNKSCSL